MPIYQQQHSHAIRIAEVGLFEAIYQVLGKKLACLAIPY